jgi:8-oxo-dGTP pyrophosphatase MutT (NUDIX family)
MNEQNRQENGTGANELRNRAEGRLLSAPQLLKAGEGGGRLCPAAVLVPIVNYPANPHMMLTRRASDHPNHGGQISFPGGAVAKNDASMEATALRETLEETGVKAHHIEVLGHLERHDTGTGFAIHPVVGLLDPGFVLRPCAREVAQIFEVPLDFLMRADHYRWEKIFWQGRERHFYVIEYENYRIWGATAAILKKLQERLLEQI